MEYGSKATCESSAVGLEGFHDCT